MGSKHRSMMSAGLQIKPRFAATAVPTVDSGSSAKSQPLYLGGATEAKSSKSKGNESTGAGVVLTAPLKEDTFSKATAETNNPTVTALADQVKNAFTQGGLLSRKSNAAFLIKCTAGIDHTQSKPLSETAPNQDKQAQLKQLAENLQKLDNQAKVRLVGDLTGGNSIYTNYAKNRLLGESGFGIKDTLELFKPKPAEKTISGYKESFGAIGVGIMSLLTVAIGGPLLSPTFLGKWVSALGLALL